MNLTLEPSLGWGERDAVPAQDLRGVLQGAAGASNSPQSVHSVPRSAQGGSAPGEAAVPTGVPASADKRPGQGGNR